jgi:hypothetical protein
VQSEADLYEVVRASLPPRVLSRGLDCRQEEAEQDCHDDEDGEEFDPGEAAAGCVLWHESGPLREKGVIRCCGIAAALSHRRGFEVKRFIEAEM